MFNGNIYEFMTTLFLKSVAVSNETENSLDYDYGCKMFVLLNIFIVYFIQRNLDKNMSPFLSYVSLFGMFWGKLGICTHF